MANDLNVPAHKNCKPNKQAGASNYPYRLFAQVRLVRQRGEKKEIKLLCVLEIAGTSRTFVDNLCKQVARAICLFANKLI